MKNKYIAAFLAFLAGKWGVHHFFTGDVGKGFLYIFATVFLAKFIPFGVGAYVIQALAIIEGIMFVMMSDDEYMQKYDKKAWSKTQKRREQERNQYDRGYNDEQEYRNRERRREEEKRRYEDDDRRAREHKQSATNRAELEALKSSGVKKFKEYDFKGAHADFEKVLSYVPDDVPTLFNMACVCSMTEAPNEGFYYLSRAVECGFRDFDKIRSHESLAYLRIQPEWDAFVQNGYRMPSAESDSLLKQLQQLAEMRAQGRLTEEQFVEQSRKLFTS